MQYTDWVTRTGPITHEVTVLVTPNAVVSIDWMLIVYLETKYLLAITNFIVLNKSSKFDTH